MTEMIDVPDTWRSPHVIFELTLIAATLATSIVLWRGWWRAKRSLIAATRALEAHAAERDAWRASAEAALAVGDSAG